jgi:hypothetical protein
MTVASKASRSSPIVSGQPIQDEVHSFSVAGGAQIGITADWLGARRQGANTRGPAENHGTARVCATRARTRTKINRGRDRMRALPGLRQFRCAAAATFMFIFNHLASLGTGTKRADL